MDHIHTHLALKVFKISCFCIWRSFEKNDFGKYRFLFKAKLPYYKIVQNICNMFWFLLKHVCISKYITELIFEEFMRIYGNLLKVKRPRFKSLNCWTGLCRSTKPEVGPPLRSIDVHKRAQQGPIDRMVDQQRVSALCKWPGRPGGHLPVYGRPAGRPLFLTVRNPTVGNRPSGRPTAGRSAELASDSHILGAYKRGFPWTVFYKIFGEFQSQFFLSIVEVFSTCLRANIFKSKGSLSRDFQKWFFEFFTTNSIQVFLTHT